MLNEKEEQEWCRNAANSLLNMFISDMNHDSETRNAALIAIRALEWLAEPKVRTEVKVTKRPFESLAYPTKG